MEIFDPTTTSRPTRALKFVLGDCFVALGNEMPGVRKPQEKGSISGEMGNRNICIVLTEVHDFGFLDFSLGSRSEFVSTSCSLGDLSLSHSIPTVPQRR